MHVGSVLLFEGEAPPLRRLRRPARAPARARPALPPEAGLPAARAEPARLGRRPALQRRLPRAPHRAARARRARRELRRLAGRVFAQRLDRTKPLWELWLVDRVGDDRFALDHQDAPLPRRRRLGRRHRDRAVRPRPRPAAAAAGRAVGAAARADARRRCWPTRWPSAPPAPLELARAAVGRGRPPAAARSRPASTAVGGLAAMTQAGLAGAPRVAAQRAHRPAPALRVGRRRPARRSRRSRARSAAPSTTSCSPSWPARCARTSSRTATTPTSSSRRWCPISVRAESERGALGNKVVGDVRAAADRARRPDRALPRDPRGDARAQGVRPGGRRRGAHLAGRTSRRRRSSPRPRGCRRCSASST